MAFGIDDAIAAGLKVLDKFVPDPAAKAQAENDLRAALLSWDAQQAKINEIEAANPNIWVSGWRPAIGWVCAASFAFIYVVAPFVTWFASFFGLTASMPQLDEMQLIGMTTSMLGLGGLRTYEKIKGIDTK